MEALEFLQKAGLIILNVAILIGVVILAFKLLVACAAIVVALWPIGCGIVGAVLLWRSGHDNMAVVVLLASAVAQGLWFWRAGKTADTGASGDGYDWRNGKVALYDKDGNRTGYKDRE